MEIVYNGIIGSTHNHTVRYKFYKKIGFSCDQVIPVETIKSWIINQQNFEIDWLYLPIFFLKKIKHIIYKKKIIEPLDLELYLKKKGFIKQQNNSFENGFVELELRENICCIHHKGISKVKSIFELNRENLEIYINNFSRI